MPEGACRLTIQDVIRLTQEKKHSTRLNLNDSMLLCDYVTMYIYTHIYTYTYACIHIYIYREREAPPFRHSPTESAPCHCASVDPRSPHCQGSKCRPRSWCLACRIRSCWVVGDAAVEELPATVSSKMALKKNL